MALLPMGIKMWKPGSSKPNNNKPPSEHQIDMPDKNSKVGAGSAKVAVAKKLSSSTMGMRFMQRKNGGNATSSASRERMPMVESNTPTKNMHGNHATNTTTNEGNNISNVDRKRKCDEILHASPPPSHQPPSSSSSGSESLLLDKAYVVDMYGLGSDIVGRRSFGGYRKSVMTTWDAALKRRTDENNTRQKNTKQHITDEELLERYEKYVKGRGGRESSSASRPSGGSGTRKDKRKRNG